MRVDESPRLSDERHPDVAAAERERDVAALAVGTSKAAQKRRTKAAQKRRTYEGSAPQGGDSDARIASSPRLGYRRRSR